MSLQTNIYICVCIICMFEKKNPSIITQSIYQKNLEALCCALICDKTISMSHWRRSVQQKQHMLLTLKRGLALLFCYQKLPSMYTGLTWRPIYHINSAEILQRSKRYSLLNQFTEQQRKRYQNWGDNRHFRLRVILTGLSIAFMSNTVPKYVGLGSLQT